MLLGVIRQEVLSGIRKEEDFEALRERLRPFPDLPVGEADHEEGARIFNRCRAKGLSLSTIDLFISAVAIRRGLPVFSLDEDFHRLAGILPLKIHRA